jgi:hypothetical protein
LNEFNFLEITSVNQMYLEEDRLSVELMGRGYTVIGVDTLLFTFIGPDSGWDLAYFYSSTE